MAIFALVIDPCTSSLWMVYPSSKPGDDWNQTQHSSLDLITHNEWKCWDFTRLTLT